MWNMEHNIYTCPECGLTYGKEDWLKFYNEAYVDQMFKLVKQYKSLNLNTEERGLLQGIGLLFTGTSLLKKVFLLSYTNIAFADEPSNFSDLIHYISSH